MRKIALVFTVAVAAGILWLPLRRPPSHRLSLTTYFRNGDGLQPKAPVRINGVELGSVTSVRVRPELGERPVEVIMEIAASYDLALPSDSTVRIETGGSWVQRWSILIPVRGGESESATTEYYQAPS